MSGDWHNPLDAILNVITSTIGWVFLFPCLVFLGILLGSSIGHHVLTATEYAACLPVAWIIFPITIPAYFLTPLAFWWPLHSGSGRAYVAAGVGTVLMWALAVMMIPL